MSHIGGRKNSHLGRSSITARSCPSILIGYAPDDVPPAHQRENPLRHHINDHEHCPMSIHRIEGALIGMCGASFRCVSLFEGIGDRVEKRGGRV
jgi:hypothetical protein